MGTMTFVLFGAFRHGWRGGASAYHSGITGFSSPNLVVSCAVECTGIFERRAQWSLYHYRSGLCGTIYLAYLGGE